MTNDRLSDTDFGLIGYPLSHSFSKSFFTEKFAREGKSLKYENFELPALDPAALYSLVLFNPRLKGFNVTAPYKEAVIEFLDKVEGVAASIGAVNTVKIVRDDTAACSVSKAIIPMSRASAKAFGLSSRVSKAPARWYSVRAAPQKRRSKGCGSFGLAPVRVSRSHKDDNTLLYADLDADVMASHPVVVNCTPLGTAPNTDSCAPLPFELLPKGAVCFDMVYNPAESLFLKRAAERGAKTKNGLEMLHRQALASLAIWQS